MDYKELYFINEQIIEELEKKIVIMEALIKELGGVLA